MQLQVANRIKDVMDINQFLNPSEEKVEDDIEQLDEQILAQFQPAFDPSRFAHQLQPASVYANSQDSSKRDHFSYGIGRRICPGIHLPERSLFTTVPRMIWGLTIQLQKDENGVPIPLDVSPDTAYSDGFLDQCRPFKVDVRPRSAERREVILTAKAAASVDVFAKYS